MKKVLKRSLSLLLAITIIFGSASVGLGEVDFAGIKSENPFAVKAEAASSGTCGDNLTWVLDDSGTLTISGTGDMNDYTYGSSAPWDSLWSSIKHIVIKKGVTSIGDDAFYYCSSLTSVIIPDSVTSIGSCAFYYCTSLSAITIPDSVTSIGGAAFDNTAYYNDSTNWKSNVLYIGNHLIEARESLSGKYTIKEGTKTIADDAFDNCTGLKSITIPDSVTSVDGYSFSNCESLTSIIVDSANPNYVSIDGVLFNKDKTELIKYPVGKTNISYTIPDSVTSIGSSSFYECTSLTSVTIPDGVTSIGSNAFSWCSSLESITIPDSVTNIGVFAFGRCSSLTSITIPDGVTNIGYGTFDYCWSLKSITIPDSVISIDENAFYYCASLKTVAIGNGVTSIGASAFGSCESLTSITIPDSVTSIGSYAFSGCDSLISVTIPDSVTSIGDAAFRYCTGLKSATIGNGVKSISYFAFGYCPSLINVTIGDSVTSIDISSFYDCKSLESITIGNSVKSIGEYAFYGCESLANVYITDLAAWCDISFGYDYSNPLSQGADLYINGKLTTDVVIPSSVTSIGDDVFYGCTSLTSVTIPKSVTSIGDSAFRECTSLISINIPDSVKSIGDDAFYYCTSLKTVAIGNGVTSIGRYAFQNCTSLTSITIPDSVTSMGDYAFYFCSSLTSVTIGDSLTNIGSYAFQNCTSLNSVTIPDNVRSIGSFAFQNCLSLKSVAIGSGVTSIGIDTFRNCISLESVEIDDGLKWIDSSVFANCTSLESIIIPDSLTQIDSNVFDDTAFYKNEDNWVNNVLYIGNHLIKARESLSGKYTIKKGTKTIAAAAFYNCTSLSSVTIPDSVTSIGGSAFYNTGYYNNSGNWDNDVLYIGNHLIQAKKTISGEYAIKKGTITISGSAFYNCTSLSSVTIPDSVTSVGASAFNNSGLTSVTIGSGVTSIDDRAFAYCDRLASVYITDLAAWCGISFDAAANPLIHANNLYINGKLATDIVIPSSVTSIGDRAFDDCTSITSVTIPNSVTSIGFCAFDGCTNLTSVKIPDSVTSIGNYAFDNCTSLTDVYYGGTKEDWANISIDLSNSSLTAATIHYSLHAPTITSCYNEVKGVQLKWNAVIDAVKYNVYRRQGGQTAWSLVGTTTGTSLMDTKVTSGIYYVYSVRAYNSAGSYSDFDTTKTITIQPVTAPTAVATNLTNGVQVKWNASAGTTKYNVYRRIGGSSSWVLVGTTTGTSLVDKGVTNGKYYVYSIRAINSTGYSAFDTKKTDTIQPVTAPTAVATNLTNGVQVKWNASAGATKYNVYRRIGGSSIWVLVGTSTGTSLIDKGVTNGKYYVYSIRAINGTGYSAFDTKKTDTIQPITAPTTKVAKKSTGVQVSWNKVTGATKYNIYRRLGGTSTWVYVGTTTNTTLLDKGVVKGKSYAYSIRAINGTGYSAYNSSKCASIKYS